MPATNIAWMTLLIAVLLALRTVLRVRRSIGRQQLRPVRMAIRMTILLLASVALLVLGLRQPVTLGAAAAGAAIGVGLALYGLRHTAMERTQAGVFYTGHPYIGPAVTLMVATRIAWRLLQAGPATAQAPGGAAFAAAMGNPLTIAAFFVAGGYYLVTDAGLLRRQGALSPATE